MGSVNYSQAIKPDIAKVRKLIENSLLADWVLRIEYDSSENESDGWRQWEETFFALRSADDVLDALKACYSKFSDRVIRINAEKIRPQTRMLYTVYNPRYLPELAGVASHTPSPEYAGGQMSASSRPGLSLQK